MLMCLGDVSGAGKEAEGPGGDGGSRQPRPGGPPSPGLLPQPAGVAAGMDPAGAMLLPPPGPNASNASEVPDNLTSEGESPIRLRGAPSAAGGGGVEGPLAVSSPQIAAQVIGETLGTVPAVCCRRGRARGQRHRPQVL